MRCLGAKVLRSTWAARTAISSSSSKAKSGTCFNSTGLHGIDHLVGAVWFRNELRATISDDGYWRMVILHLQRGVRAKVTRIYSVVWMRPGGFRSGVSAYERGRSIKALNGY